MQIREKQNSETRACAALTPREREQLKNRIEYAKGILSIEERGFDYPQDAPDRRCLEIFLARFEDGLSLSKVAKTFCELPDDLTLSEEAKKEYGNSWERFSDIAKNQIIHDLYNEHLKNAVGDIRRELNKAESWFLPQTPAEIRASIKRTVKQNIPLNDQDQAMCCLLACPQREFLRSHLKRSRPRSERR